MSAEEPRSGLRAPLNREPLTREQRRSRRKRPVRARTVNVKHLARMSRAEPLELAMMLERELSGDVGGGDEVASGEFATSRGVQALPQLRASDAPAPVRPSGGLAPMRPSDGEGVGARAAVDRRVGAPPLPVRHGAEPGHAPVERAALEREFAARGAGVRPTRRSECADGPRPCPFVSCKHHLYLDVSPRTGSIKFNFPDLEVWELAESCALDIADSGGTTLESVGEIMNLTRERVRQLESRALSRMHVVRELTGDLEPARNRR